MRKDKVRSFPNNGIVRGAFGIFAVKGRYGRLGYVPVRSETPILDTLRRASEREGG